MLTNEEKLEIMEAEMSASWEQIDALFSSVAGTITFTRKAWGLDWAEAKWPLFEKFGRKLKLTAPIEDALTQSEISDALDDKVLDELNRHPMSTKEFNTLKVFFSFFSIDEIAKNKFFENKTILGVDFQEGSKISRALKRVLDNPKLVNEIQVMLSRFNESLLARGELQVSFDPIDLLMMSYNKVRTWTSCHNIFDGCYGAGSISYLLDSSSFIAQIILPRKDGEDREGDPRNIVPEKVWRRMGMFDDDLEVIFLSRSYPSSNANNTKAFKELMKETFGEEDVATGFIDSRDAENMIVDASDIHYCDITHGALTKVPVIVLNKDKFSITGKNDSEEIFRSKISNFLLTKFHVGSELVVSPTLDFNIEGSIEEDGVFSEEDDYYDDDYDEEWD